MIAIKANNNEIISYNIGSKSNKQNLLKYKNFTNFFSLINFIQDFNKIARLFLSISRITNNLAKNLLIISKYG